MTGGRDTGEAPEPTGEARNIRFLRRLVTVLTVTMIAGLVTLIALLVIRLGPGAPRAALPLPETIELPEGATAAAVTLTETRILVVTQAHRLLVFDRSSGRLRQQIAIE